MVRAVGNPNQREGTRVAASGSPLKTEIHMRAVQRAFGYAGLVLAALAGTASGQIQWQSGLEPPRFVMENTSDVLRAEAGRHLIVKLTAPITPPAREKLASLGLTLKASLRDYTFFASLDVGANVDALTASGWLAGAAPILTEWKLHRDIVNEQLPSWAVNTPEGASEPMAAVYVTLHRGVAQGAGADLVVKHRGEVHGLVGAINAVVAHVPVSSLRALAGEDGVQWIEPALPQLEGVNAQNRELVGANVLQAAPYGLNGEGVTVLVFDAGTAMPSHLDLAGRVTVLDSSGTSTHATHVAGTVGGTGVASGGANRGMAPGVTLLSAGVNISGVSGWLYSNPCDIEADYTLGWNAGADFATNSIGTNVGSNGFDCNWEGDYGGCAAVIDGIVRGSSVTGGSPFRVVWAGGNERATGRCGATYRTIGPPAGAKNHLSIGSVDSDTDLSSWFTGWGPTDDGRMKPDFSAPGCQVGGDTGVTSCADFANNAYTSMCGTSMATPTVTGCSSLLLQDFRARNPGAPDPRNSTFKVIFAQTSVDRGNPGPDYVFGYGSMRAQAAVDLMRAGNFAEGEVQQGVDSFFNILVPAGQDSLSVTLAWDDFPGTGNVIPALINDLDVELYAPNGELHRAWTLDSQNPANNAVRNAPNRLDNLEQAKVDNPMPGVWQVRVHAFDVPEGPQTFSVASSHTLTSGTPFPAVTIITAQYPTQMNPNATSIVAADIFVQADELVEGSVRLNYRASTSESFSFVPMVNTNANRWTATLPGFPCSATPQFFISAEGVTTGQRTAPATGAAAPYTAAVIERVLVDDFETDAGWTSQDIPNPGRTLTGSWERADPQGTSAQPADDHTPNPGVNCWVTGATAGASVTSNDVSHGATVLTSPALNLGSGGDYVIEYWRWFSSNVPNFYNDPFLVQITNDDGATWHQFELIPQGAPVQPGWVRVARNYSEFGLPASSNVRLRFRAEDVGVPSVVEVAIDDFVVTRIGCVDAPTCDPDVNCDGSADQGDVACMILAVAGDISCFCQSDPDFNRDGSADQADVAAIIQTVAGAPCP